jgi:hypothetical protein
MWGVYGSQSRLPASSEFATVLSQLANSDEELFFEKNSTAAIWKLSASFHFWTVDFQ